MVMVTNTPIKPWSFLQTTMEVDSDNGLLGKVASGCSVEK